MSGACSRCKLSGRQTNLIPFPNTISRPAMATHREAVTENFIFITHSLSIRYRFINALGIEG